MRRTNFEGVTVSEEERSYFRERAEAEIRAAQSAGHPEAAKAHYVLAGYYLDLSYNPTASLMAFVPAGEG